MTFFLIPLCALANRLAGWDRWPLGKAGAMAFPAAAIGLPAAFEEVLNTNSIYHSALLAAIVYLGLLLWRVPATRNTLAAIHGRYQVNLAWDGKIVYRLTGKREGKLFGVVAGFFRGGIASVPLAAVMAWLGGVWLVFAWFPLLAGVTWAFCYWLSGAFGERTWSVPVAEALTGACMGGLVCLAA